MRSALFLLLVFLVPALAQADDPVNETFILKAKVSTQEYRQKMVELIATNKKFLTKAKRGVINPRVTEPTLVKGNFVFPDGESRTATIAEHEKAIENGETIIKYIDARQFWYLPSITENLAVGDIGKWREPIKVRQIIEDDVARVELGDTTCFLKGVSVKNLADGDSFEYDKPLQVTGTQQYKTVLGAVRTEYIVEPIADEKVLNMLMGK